MPRPGKSTTRQKRGSSKLIKEMEKLATALERNALYALGHPFRKLEVETGEFDLALNKTESA
jgi:hypothetical protein